jgi:queuine tRNA-ribosyltransferase
MGSFAFNLIARDPATSARSGLLATAHGEVRTPAFMPVGTRATVKGLTPAQLAEVGAEIVLANAYHLYLRPGVPVVREAGGLHSFMGWDWPILTDSGGFQIFSLADTFELTDEGVRFRSVLDGSEHEWSVEDAMRIQMGLGADIAMVLDECPPYPADEESVAGAVLRSAAWAATCREIHDAPEQALFGIVQGGVYPELRAESVRRTVEIGFDGYGIGGYSVGEPHDLMLDTLGAVTGALPEDRPRYLMGVGNPTTLLEAIGLGVDMFDCVLPTRTARMGTAFSSEGRLNLKNARFAEDQDPLDAGCSCGTCTTFSRAYLRHLVASKEMLAGVLLSMHNLHFLAGLTARARVAVEAGRFRDFLEEWRASRAADDY